EGSRRVANSNHLVERSDGKATQERQHTEDPVPVAQVVEDAATDAADHVLERRAAVLQDAPRGCDAGQEAAEVPRIALLDHGEGERAGDAGKALDDVAVVEHGETARENGGDRAGL